MMKRKIELLKNFAATALCFLCAMVIIKIFDYLTLVSFLRSTAHCLITSSFIVVIVFVIHLLVSLISRKAADWTSSIIFGIIVFGEIGLTIYTRESGQLMGKELFIRPISELMQTILATMSIYTIILIILGVIGGFAQLANRARKRWRGRWIMIFVSVLAVISIPYVFFIDNVISDQLEARNNETSKMWYMAISSMSANEETDNIDITYNDAQKTLTIGNRKGQYKGMVGKRAFCVVYVTKDNPQPLYFLPKEGDLVWYNGVQKTIKLQ